LYTLVDCLIVHAQSIFLLLQYPGHFSSSTAAPFQQALPAKNIPPNFASCNGNHSATVATSDLPLLTGEDLKILEAFDPVGAVGGGSQFHGGNSQMVHQQAAINGHGSVMI
jgi:hypothetical protein